MSAAPVTLGWNPSNDPSVAGYAVYYGPASTGTPSRIDAGASAQATIGNLTAGVNYTIYVVAYDSQGNESAPSNFIAYHPSAISKLKLGRQANGSMNLNFRTGPSASCTVRYATKLGSPWTSLANVQADTNGVVNYVDAPAAGAPSRFYEVMRSN